MNTTLFYAAILVGTQVLLNLIASFTGLQSDHIRYLQYLQWLGMIVFFVVLYLGAEVKRKEQPNQALTFGSALGTIFLIGLTYAAIGSVTNYVHFQYVSPNFPDYWADHFRSQMLEQGIPDAQAEQAAEMQRKLFQPVFGSIMFFVMTLISSLILGLLHSMALVRRRSLTSLLTIYAIILGTLGLLFGGLGGLAKHEFLLGAAKGLAINVAIAVIGWGALLKATGYAADAPPPEPTM